MVIVQVAPEASDPSVHVTSFPTFPHKPGPAAIPPTVKDPGAGTESGIVSATWTLTASDGPLFVTTIV